ncbi:MBL fold metallo-hydrolase [Synechococcus sp. PCC 6312]|uniref:MBL fold metallo-hydrolase n=1 Tax=Synechococcus sp. (strain ATCC 27167 / PCC 6312) TaxID=195253 RepID=UPI00029EE697|nr:MBL fold metallo-hydrolase [Synechococcus sp. PCC 6312]AFY60741.1 putative Zn-dependent hydrolase of beta-lactamase fold protein [Synechococcus sp. PCC 6312]
MVSLCLTWLDLNSWLVELDNQRILIDPWLVGPMTFGLPAWLLQFTRLTSRPCPERIDLILLSQGLPDHTHAPSLQQLDPQIPLLCPPSASEIVQKLGFQQVTVLDHGDRYSLGEIHVHATLGSPIGPLRQENGYVLKSQASGCSLYYEPHGYHDPALSNFAPIDVVITPISDVNLPLLGTIIAGKSHGLELVTAVNPQVIVPTAQPGEIQATGLLARLLHALDMSETLETALAQFAHPPQVLHLSPGQRHEISLKPSPALI